MYGYSVASLAALCGLVLSGSTQLAQASTYKVLHSFQGGSDGEGPESGLVKVGGKLYGTTRYGGPENSGVAYAVNPSDDTESVAYAFKGGSDGAQPVAGLIKARGILYGTTVAGGAFGAGTVFSLDPTTCAENVLYSFRGSSDGGSPRAGLLAVGGTLYGTTAGGGSECQGGTCGTVFALNLATRTETVLHAFQGGNDGAFPAASLIEFQGKLYGTTMSGGAYGTGTVYVVSPKSGREKVVFAFQGTGTPAASLINVNGTFYGTTALPDGTVFSLSPATGSAAVIYYFNQHSTGDGENPYAGVVNVAGLLYGTTLSGGSQASGTAFSVNPATGVETILHDFSPADGFNPEAGLIDVNGTLYGATSVGGSAGNCSCGTVFSLTP